MTWCKQYTDEVFNTKPSLRMHNFLEFAKIYINLGISTNLITIDFIAVSLMMKFHLPLFQHECNAWLALIKATNCGFLGYHVITTLFSAAVLEMQNALPVKLWAVHIKCQSIRQLNCRANVTYNTSECAFVTVNAEHITRIQLWRTSASTMKICPFMYVGNIQHSSHLLYSSSPTHCFFFPWSSPMVQVH